MHELSLAHSLTQMALNLATENQATCVHSVTIAVGALSGVDIDALRFVLPELCRGTLLETSQFLFEKVATKILCQSCHQESTPVRFQLICTHCQSSETTLISGKEFKIISLEVE